MTSFGKSIDSFARRYTSCVGKRLARFGAAILIAGITTTAALAVPAEDMLFKAITLLSAADNYSEKGFTNQAKAKYGEAQTALLDLKKEHPTWNPNVVTFRLNYVAGKITALSTPPAATTPGATAANAKSADALPANVSVKLLTPGAAPQRELRLQAKAGDRQEVVRAFTTTSGMGGVGAPAMMMKLPGVKLTMVATVKEVSATGDVSYDLLFDAVDVVEQADGAPGMADNFKTALSPMKGLTVSGVMANRGFVKKSDFKIPSSLPPEARAGIAGLKESMDHSEIILPQEAVGVGGRWEVKQRIKKQGVNIDITTIHELVAAEGNVFTIKSSAVQSAPPNQKVSHPMLPQAVDVVTLSGKVSGETSLDLTRVLPLQETAFETSETTIAMGPDGQKQNLVVKSEAKSELSSK